MNERLLQYLIMWIIQNIIFLSWENMNKIKTSFVHYIGCNSCVLSKHVIVIIFFLNSQYFFPNKIDYSPLNITKMYMLQGGHYSQKIGLVKRRPLSKSQSQIKLIKTDLQEKQVYDTKNYKISYLDGTLRPGLCPQPINYHWHICFSLCISSGAKR